MNWGDELEQGLTLILGGVVLVAIVSEIVSANSSAASLVQATGSAVGNIVGSAVSPLHTHATNASPLGNPFSAPSFSI